MPSSSTPNFADPLGYGHRIDQYYSANNNFVPFGGAVGFGNAMHGPFGYAHQPSGNFGQYASAFGSTAFGPTAFDAAAAFGATSFGMYRNSGYNLNDEPHSNYTSINQSTQSEEIDQKNVLPSVDKKSRD